MLTDSGSQEHIHSSCHIQTKLVENFFCLIFDGSIGLVHILSCLRSKYKSEIEESFGYNQRS